MRDEPKQMFVNCCKNVLGKNVPERVFLNSSVTEKYGHSFNMTSFYQLLDVDTKASTADIRKAIPRRDLAEAWRDIELHAKELAKRLSGKEAATPSRTWKLLSSARQEMVLYLAVTARQEAVAQKIKNFFTKWRQVQQKIPLPEMTELLITPQLPEYPKIAEEVFMLLLDGKLRSRTEILKFLKALWVWRHASRVTRW